MTLVLPGDVLYMILDILGDEKDYNSLYQCALSSKCFTEFALTSLYKLYNTSPVRSGGTDDEQLRNRRPAPTLARKWALMWRSIVLSTFGQTYLPYYSYIRYLDLDDLDYLLKDSGFTGKIKQDFFTPEVLDFVSKDYSSKGSKRLRSSRIFPDNEWIMTKLGGAIVERATSIRGMSCNISSSTLVEWLERLPLLRTLSVWSGAALTDHAGDKLRAHCPDFKQLTIYGWASKTAETDCEEFLNELSPNTLEYFEVFSYSHLGPRSIKALGCHLDSLRELKLTSLSIEAIAELPTLAAPPELEVLVLTDSIPTAKTDEFYSIITRVAEWIRSCKALKRLDLRKFVDDPNLLSQVLTEDGFQLSSLSLEGYIMSQSRAFHEALGSQQSLRSLYLRGESTENYIENEVFVQALLQLNNLEELELKDISDGFSLNHIAVLTPFLPHLNRLWISGDYLNDEVWKSFQCLPNLRSLVIHALSEFTSRGILDFISRLGPGNHGFSLSILNATTDANITEEAQTVIRETLKTKLDGSFDFGLAQEEFSDMDSDAEMSD
ncbi:hypothetical protein P170DRAFT_386160 [Aspergillus steynii IBT 23096]|uniref:F-box domain-containing protein n=1 Tax=Aspergillus steynii IBT 23096 TaxID=1392250 RepID=A0A2I2G564_9EURO|nr:uncharacterized protein P170DRAFT_386160 [Aspergillus steynii IBT 23096]PLB48017.1 hypothetical protein P170DRAFT_386160 [Aspergillus steynii IBT 23096]